MKAIVGPEVGKEEWKVESGFSIYHVTGSAVHQRDSNENN
jgi:hypothetical protein